MKGALAIMPRSPKTVRQWVVFVAFMSVLALPGCDFLGCDYGPGPIHVDYGVPPKATPTPNPAQKHLYVADELSPGHVYAYALPIVADSDAPTATINAGNGPFGLALDSSGKLYVANDQDNSLFVIDPPLATAAVPTVILSPAAGLSDVAVLPTGGQLFVGGLGQVAVYTLPLTMSSTPAFLMNNSVANPHGVGFDDNGNLWDADNGNQWVWFPPPFSASEIGTTRYFGYGLKKIIGHSGQLFVSHDTQIDVYIEATLTLAFTLNLPVSADLAEGEAFDATGTFYVAAGSHIYVYAAPLTASSKPIHTLTTPSMRATNIAIGM